MQKKMRHAQLHCQAWHERQGARQPEPRRHLKARPELRRGPQPKRESNHSASKGAPEAGSKNRDADPAKHGVPIPLSRRPGIVVPLLTRSALPPTLFYLLRRLLSKGNPSWRTPQVAARREGPGARTSPHLAGSLDGTSSAACCQRLAGWWSSHRGCLGTRCRGAEGARTRASDQLPADAPHQARRAHARRE
jgi:hypothetical protein